MYAPRSVDPTEATVLTPAAGAPHSDKFLVASIDGVSDANGTYKPYLHDSIIGRRGRIELLKRKLDVGTLTAKLIDKTLASGDNLTRWWSAFFGDVKGRPMGRLKIEIDECLDHTATSPTWSRFATMELVGTKLEQKNVIVLSLRDRVETLKMRTFVGQPHASLSYVAQPTLLPIGFRKSDYGKLAKTLPLTGITNNLINVSGTAYTPSGERGVTLDAASSSHELNIITKNLFDIAPPGRIGVGTDLANVFVLTIVPQYTTTLRCRLKQTSGGASGTEGDYKVGAIGWRETTNGPGQKPHYQLRALMLKALETTDVGYAAIPAAGVSCEIHLYNDGEAARERPLLLNDVDPATYIQDLCAGYFSQLYRPPMTLPTGKSYGDPIQTVTTNGVSSLVGTRPKMRLAVTKPSSVIDEIERVCLENNWAPYVDANGRLNVVDLTLPTSFGAVDTITDADVVEEDDPAWEHDPTQAVRLVKMKRYSERIVSPPEIWQSDDEYPELKGLGLVDETAHPLENLYIGSIDFGEEVLHLDARGYRSMEGEEYQAQDRAVYYENKLVELGNEFARPFGYGLTTIPLRCRRTTVINNITPGAVRKLDVDVIPDPATHKRGGRVIVRVLEKSEDGPEISLLLAFLASDTVADTPTLGAPAQETGNTWTGATTAVTVNAAGHPVQVRYAITETSVGTVPADDSPLWTIAGVQRGTGTFTIRQLWPGKRVWVQGRSFPLENTSAYTPSAWVNAGGTGRVDMATIPAPSLLAASSVTDKTALLTWTNGASDVGIEILLMTPVGDVRRRIAMLDPGATRFALRNLSPSTTYRAEVRHAIGMFYGTGVTVDLTTPASGATTAPAITRHQIIT